MTSPEQPEQASPTPGEAYFEGDLEIISSDRISFKTQSYHLLSASTVIRNMFSTSSHKERKLELADGECEDATTVRFLLDTSTGQDLHDPASPAELPDIDDIGHLLSLARKFDCSQVTRTCRFLLMDQLYGETYTEHEVFQVAPANRFDDLCERALARVGRARDDDDSLGDKLGTVKEFSSHLCNWALEYWMKVPPENMWAFMRCQKSSRDWLSRSREFKVLLKEVQKRRDEWQ